MLALGDWNTASWISFAIFLALLLVGAILALLGWRRGASGNAHRILAERLARGEIAPDEYRERTHALRLPPRRGWLWIGTGLAAAGLIGSIAVASMAGPGFMHMMNGGMDSMMGSGETQRSGSPPVAGAREIRISAREFSFDPKQISIRIGQTVNLRFASRGHMFHTFTVGELGVNLQANAGDEIAGSFKPERAGTYTFVCTVSGHAQAGMQGTLTITS